MKLFMAHSYLECNIIIHVPSHHPEILFKCRLRFGKSGVWPEVLISNEFPGDCWAIGPQTPPWGKRICTLIINMCMHIYIHV
jgi:hypothetical protein